MYSDRHLPLWIQPSSCPALTVWLCLITPFSLITLGNHWSQLRSFVFSRLSHSWDPAVCGFLRLDFSHSVIPLQFHALVAHAFLAWNTTPLFGCFIVYLVTDLRAFGLFLSFGNYKSGCYNIFAYVFVWCNFKSCLGTHQRVWLLDEIVRTWIDFSSKMLKLASNVAVPF